MKPLITDKLRSQVSLDIFSSSLPCFLLFFVFTLLSCLFFVFTLLSCLFFVFTLLFCLLFVFNLLSCLFFVPNLLSCLLFISNLLSCIFFVSTLLLYLLFVSTLLSCIFLSFYYYNCLRRSISPSPFSISPKSSAILCGSVSSWRESAISIIFLKRRSSSIFRSP